VSFQFLATGVGHDEEGHKKGRVGSPRQWVMGELYHNDQGNELNPMG
jgi:hypothetical protein